MRNNRGSSRRSFSGSYRDLHTAGTVEIGPGKRAPKTATVVVSVFEGEDGEAETVLRVLNSNGMGRKTIPPACVPLLAKAVQWLDAFEKANKKVAKAG